MIENEMAALLPPPKERPPTAPAGITLLGGLILLFAALVAWSGRAPDSDFFMALGGGEDVVAGRLNKPDTWSYITNGRVWINQSWLTGWAFCRLWRIGGPASAVIARCVLLAALITGLAAWLRQRQASWPAACVAISIFLLVCRFYFALRGNLITIVAVPWLLWMLGRQRAGSAHWAWPIAALLAIWAHCHGGHVFGWAVVGLWLFVHALPAALGHSPWHMRRWLMLLVPTAAAAGLTTLVSPFGHRVFTQTLTMVGQAEWHTIRDWWPLIRDWNTPWAEWKDTFEETGPFTLYVLGTFGLVVTFVIVNGSRRTVQAAVPTPTADEKPLATQDAESQQPPQASTNLAAWVRGAFDVVLIGVTLIMAFKGRRFVPLSAITLALPVALCLDSLWSMRANFDMSDPSRRLGIAAGTIGTLLLLVFGLLLYPMLVHGYSQRHPFNPPQTIFERQFMANGFPVAAARFMNVHRIEGPVFHPYGSETYLHWEVPGALVTCGGRAQQIYTDRDLQRSRAMEDPRFLQPQAFSLRNEYFRKSGVGILVLPVGPAGNDWNLILGLMGFAPAGTAEWMPVLFDGEWCVLVEHGRFERLWTLLQDTSHHGVVEPKQDPTGALATAQVADGKIVFSSELARLRTFALYLCSPRLTGQDVPPEQRAALEDFIFRLRMSAIDEAQRLWPTPLLYDLLDRLARRRPASQGDIRPYLEAEWARLKTMPVEGPRCADIVRSRLQVASLLSQRYHDAGDQLKSAQMRSEMNQAIDDLLRLARWWQL